MPDVFVAVDTSYNSSYFRKLAGKNVLNSLPWNILTETGLF